MKPRWLALALVLGFGASSCASTKKAAPEAPRPIDLAFVPAFESLDAAVRARDDELAARILSRIYARTPDDATRALADVYQRILEGRTVARALTLRLEAESDPKGHTFEVFLVAEHSLEQALELRSGPASVHFLCVVVDPTGIEQRVATSRSVSALRDLSVPAGERVRIDLGPFDMPAASVPLAARASWELDPVSGEFRFGGATLPASGLAVAPCDLVRLAPWLPNGAVEPAELARYLGEPGFSTPAMLERTVRIDSARRPEALDLVTPVALAMDRIALARAVPALRWLAGHSELGADGESWRAWLVERAQKREVSGAAPSLDLPDAPPPAVAASHEPR